jgi:Nucleotide-diphospho-sugar transferase
VTAWIGSCAKSDAGPPWTLWYHECLSCSGYFRLSSRDERVSTHRSLAQANRVGMTIGGTARVEMRRVGLVKELCAMNTFSGDEKLPNTVMYTIATAGYVSFALNLLESMRRVGLGSQLVIFTPDQQVCAELSSLGVHCRYFPHQQVAKWSEYGTSGFGAIAAYKFAVGCDILDAGSNALFVDGDIVFLRNPIQYLREIVEGSSAELVMQFESPKEVYNTGFWYAKSDPLVSQLFKDIQHSLLVEKAFNCDQECFNSLIPGKRQIRIAALDVKLFACGNQFLDVGPPEGVDLHSNPFPFDAAYLLHFNYVVGREQKIAAMKKCGALIHFQLASEFKGDPPAWQSAAAFGRLRGRLKRVMNEMKQGLRMDRHKYRQ